jgi:hypothetical protein
VVLNDLSRLEPLRNAFTEIVTSTTDPASAAASDRADELAALAYDLAATFIVAAADHLAAWRALVADARIVPSFAFVSLCRVAHEAAFSALWLLEPVPTVADRAARGLAAQLDDYDERRKLEAALGVTKLTGRAKTAAERYDDLFSEAQRRGMTKLNKKNAQVLAVPMPSVIELFDRFEPTKPGSKGSFVYRLYSGYAHGKQWATVQGAQQVADLDETDRAQALVRSNPTALIAATQRAMNAFEGAVGAFVALHEPGSERSEPGADRTR